MTESALFLFVTVFEACADWLTDIFESIGATGYVLASFLIVLVVFLFLIPMRGSGFGTDAGMDFTKTVVNKIKTRKKTVHGFGRK